MNIYEKILDIERQNLSGVLVTVIRKEGHGPQVPGVKMLITENGENFGTIGGGAIEYAALNEYSKVIEIQKSYTKKYLLDENNKLIDAEKTGMICGGEITLFFECIKPKPSVFIFGAGHVGRELADFLGKLSYNITILDSREDIGKNIKGANRFINQDYISALDSGLNLNDNFVVILTHSHELDYTVLKKICEISSKPKYIGLIASKKKSEKIVGRLCSELGNNLDLSKLFSPVGLKIGGRSPAEIALSIASEIQTVNYSVTELKHASRDWNKEIQEKYR